MMDTATTNASAPMRAEQATHTVPTHLAGADTVLSLGYLSLSSRQLLLLLLGGSVTASWWVRTAWLATLLPPIGSALHWLSLLLLGSGVLALTFGQALGRSFDAWIIVLLAYLTRPRIYLWHTIRHDRFTNEPVSQTRGGGA